MPRSLFFLAALLLITLSAPALAQEAIWQAYLDSAAKAEDKGDYAEAEKFLVMAEKEADDFPPGDRKRANGWFMRAGWYDRQFKYDGTEAQYKKCVDLGAKGKDQAFHSYSMTLLANHYRMRGKFDLAEPIYKKALIMREKVSGPNNWETASLLRDYADMLRDAGKYEAAQAIYKKAFKIFEIDKTKPFQTAFCLANLGETYLRQGKLVEAEALCQQSLKLYGQLPQPSPINTALCYGTLGEIQRHQNKIDEAAESFDKAVGFLEGEEKAVSIRLYSTFANAAKFYKERGRSEEAKKVGDQAAEILKKHNKGAGVK